MPTITVKEDSAASAVGTNLLAGNRVQISPNFRRVKRLGFVGSAAIGDASVDLFYGSEYIGTFFNTTAGASKIPTNDTDMLLIADERLAVPGEPLNLLVSDAGATNIVVATLEIEEFAA